MPRMRAIAGAFYILLMTFIGLALGPYTIGKLSDLFIAQGMSDAEGLRLALATSLLVFIPSVYCWCRRSGTCRGTRRRGWTGRGRWARRYRRRGRRTESRTASTSVSYCAGE